MSLIDTICIGTYGTVVELAATGPASLLFAAPAVLFSAFSATALADISRAQSRGDTRAAGLAFARTLRDAAIAGTVVMLLYGLCSSAVVSTLNVSQEVLPYAAPYLAVRALAAPAVMASAVCSAALLAQHDSRSPSLVVAMAATFNLVADVALIVGFGLGLTGAAVATVATQYLSLAVLAYVCSQPQRLSPDFAALFGRNPPQPPAAAPAAVASIPQADAPAPSAHPAADAPAPSAQSQAATATLTAASEPIRGTPSPAPLVTESTATLVVDQPEMLAPAAEATEAAAPSPSDAAPGAAASMAAEAQADSGGALALVLVYAAKTACYFVVQGAAMRLDVVQLAAHNAVFSVWNMCAYFPVPLQTTALAFVPACASFHEFRHVARVLIGAAAALAVPLALTCCLLPLFLPHLLTAEPAVIAAMRPLAPTAGLSILLCTLDVACEGVLVAQRRLRYLIGGMTAVLVAVVAYFAAGHGSTVGGAWFGLLMFFGMRCMLSGAGVLRGMMDGRRSTEAGGKIAASHA
eukprot:jgi/Ulvmu1/9757/UM055_0097.1